MLFISEWFFSEKQEIYAVIDRLVNIYYDQDTIKALSRRGKNRISITVSFHNSRDKKKRHSRINPRAFISIVNQ